MTYIFDIIPVGKPRMTQSDKWRTHPNDPDPDRSERPAVTRYRQFRHDIQWLTKAKKYTLGETLHIIFYLPMPESWTEKKRLEMNGQPHKQKPDTSNLVKSFEDCLTIDDSRIWHIDATKYWAEHGSIVVMEK